MEQRLPRALGAFWKGFAEETPAARTTGSRPSLPAHRCSSLTHTAGRPSRARRTPSQSLVQAEPLASGSGPRSEFLSFNSARGLQFPAAPLNTSRVLQVMNVAPSTHTRRERCRHLCFGSGARPVPNCWGLQGNLGSRLNDASCSSFASWAMSCLLAVSLTASGGTGWAQSRATEPGTATANAPQPALPVPPAWPDHTDPPQTFIRKQRRYSRPRGTTREGLSVFPAGGSRGPRGHIGAPRRDPTGGSRTQSQGRTQRSLGVGTRRTSGSHTEMGTGLSPTVPRGRGPAVHLQGLTAPHPMQGCFQPYPQPHLYACTPPPLPRAPNATE